MNLQTDKGDDLRGVRMEKSSGRDATILSACIEHGENSPSFGSNGYLNYAAIGNRIMTIVRKMWNKKSSTINIHSGHKNTLNQLCIWSQYSS